MFYERQTSFLFGPGGGEAGADSADGSQCPLCLLRGSCLPPEVPRLWPLSLHSVRRNRGIRFWQHSWGFGGHSAADNISAQSPGQDSAGPRSRAAVGRGHLVWVAEGRSGRGAAARPSQAEGTGWERFPRGTGRPSQGRRRLRTEPALCASERRVCLGRGPPRSRQEAAPCFRGPASRALSKASGSSSLPCSPPGRADPQPAGQPAAYPTAAGLSWTGCRCRLKSAEGSVRGSQVCQAGLCEMRFVCLCHSLLALATVAVQYFCLPAPPPPPPRRASWALVCGRASAALRLRRAGGPLLGPRLPPLPPCGECPAPARDSLRL